MAIETPPTAPRPLIWQFSLPGRHCDLNISMPADLSRVEIEEVESLFELIVRSQLRRIREVPDGQDV